MARILFIHQNFPAQFRYIAPALASDGHEVVALGVNRREVNLPGVRYLAHRQNNAARPPTTGTLNDFDTKLIRGEFTAASLVQLRDTGFKPDIIFAHPGWGEAMFIKDIFPLARLIIYAEYFYQAEGGDSFFDPEFSRKISIENLWRVRLRNTHLLHAMSASDSAISPTFFQRDRHPPWFQDKISVIHDGIDTHRFRPDSTRTIRLASQDLELRHDDEVVTFVSRHLEPYRGYHSFMRAIPHIQRLRPRARIVIVGGDGASYGAKAPPGTTWKEIFRNEIASQVDMRRIHYVGNLPHTLLTQLMQVSAVYTYLTYPFVLSWSLLEAMSVGCLVVGSRTAPVEEVIEHGHNGLLVDFFDPDQLASTVAYALENRGSLATIRENARRTIEDRYDLRTICLPAQRKLILD